MKVLIKGAFNPFSGYGNDGCGMAQTLIDMGLDVYLHPLAVTPPLPPQIAALLTKRLEAPFDLMIHHVDPGQLGLDEPSRRAADVCVAWTMWEYSSLQNLKSRFSHRKRFANYDAVIAYDTVTAGALEPHLGKDRPKLGVVQGGYWPKLWPYAERDWHSERFGFAQPLDARVLTPDGWRAMGDLAVGDFIVDPAGGIQKIQAVLPRGEMDIYRVRLADGSETRCTADHLWRVRSHSAPEWQVRSLAEITRQGLRDGTSYRWVLPDPVVDGEAVELPLDPYVLGALLGDGACPGDRGRPVVLSSADREIVNRVSRGLPAGHELSFIAVDGQCEKWSIVACGRSSVACARCGTSCRKLIARSLCRSCYNTEHLRGRIKEWPRRSSNGVSRVIREMGLAGHRAWEKFIPQPYLHASREQRLELLRGLMDTDGTVGTRVAGKGGTTPHFVTTSLQLAHDVQALVRSLGGYAGLTLVGVRGGQRSQYVVSVLVDDCPFALERKARLWFLRQKGLLRKRRRRIVSVEPVGRALVQCIEVSGDDGVYVTDDYIVTHNCMEGQLHQRKDPFVAIQAFQELKEELPEEFEPAELHLKTNITGLHPAIEEMIPKLRIHYDVWPHDVLQQFYAKQHVLLAPSRGEGKNLPALQFLSTGGTVIATNWGGHQQWLHPSYAYPLDYELRPVSGTYPDCLQARASKDHLKALMLHTFRNRNEAREKGRRGADMIPGICGWHPVMERLFANLAELVPGGGHLLAQYRSARARVNTPMQSVAYA